MPSRDHMDAHKEIFESLITSVEAYASDEVVAEKARELVKHFRSCQGDPEDVHEMIDTLVHTFRDELMELAAQGEFEEQRDVLEQLANQIGSGSMKQITSADAHTDIRIQVGIAQYDALTGNVKACSGAAALSEKLIEALNSGAATVLGMPLAGKNEDEVFQDILDAGAPPQPPDPEDEDKIK